VRAAQRYEYVQVRLVPDAAGRREVDDLFRQLSPSPVLRLERILVWGAALTRFVSIAGNKYGKEFLSVGRVQTPLLALIVDRDKEIKAFSSKAYWEIMATLAKGESAFTATHKRGRFDKKEEAAVIHKKMGKTGTVKELSTDRKKEPAPIPFNTTEMLKAASAIGFTAASAMQVAEALYINGWISYRVPTTRYIRPR
jgi:DNA topoisomerase I